VTGAVDAPASAILLKVSSDPRKNSCAAIVRLHFSVGALAPAKSGKPRHADDPKLNLRRFRRWFWGTFRHRHEMELLSPMA